MSLWSILSRYQEAFGHGLRVTAELCLIIWIAGLFLGTILGGIAAHFHKTVGMFVRAMSFVVASIPVLVFLVWLHYPAQQLLNVVVDPFWTAAAALSIVNIFAVAEVFRQTLSAFEVGYLEAARVAGMTEREAFVHVQLPLLLRQVAPALLNQQVAMLQATLFASLISVEEIFRVAQRVNAEIYRPVEIFTVLALFFVAICLPLNLLAAGLARRLRMAQSANTRVPE